MIRLSTREDVARVAAQLSSCSCDGLIVPMQFKGEALEALRESLRTLGGFWGFSDAKINLARSGVAQLSARLRTGDARSMLDQLLRKMHAQSVVAGRNAIRGSRIHP